MSPREFFRQVAAEQDGQGCRLWTFASAPGGYATMKVDGRTQRVTWLMLAAVGQPWHPPLGSNAKHSCDTPACIAPWHLSWGTPKSNVRESYERGRRLRTIERCKRDHAYDGANTYITPAGQRQCRACHAIRERQRRAAA